MRASSGRPAQGGNVLKIEAGANIDARNWLPSFCANWTAITPAFARQVSGSRRRMGTTLHDVGRDVVIQIGERRVHGRAESLDADGALLLRTEHGHLERFVGGDVSLEKTAISNKAGGLKP